MSAKGCSPDNAAAEGFFGRLKNELFYGRDWRGVGYEEFRERLAAYLTHYNETRTQEVTGLDEPRAIPQKSWTGRLTVQKNIRSPLSIGHIGVGQAKLHRTPHLIGSTRAFHCATGH